MLRSPVYRALVASGKRRGPVTARFRALARISAWDNYSEIAWKSTRGGRSCYAAFQWEQKQEVYFVVDQSRHRR